MLDSTDSPPKNVVVSENSTSEEKKKISDDDDDELYYGVSPNNWMLYVDSEEQKELLKDHPRK